MAATAEVPFGVDQFRATLSGAMLLIGWLGDVDDLCESVILEASGVCQKFERGQFHRFERLDLAQALQPGVGGRNHGIWLFEPSVVPRLSRAFRRLSFRSGPFSLAHIRQRPQILTDEEIRDATLEFLVNSPTARKSHLSVMRELDDGVGDGLIKLNRRILGSHQGTVVSTFNVSRKKITRSFITCLYGHPELLHLQVALFSACRPFEEMEHVFLCNSPELGEELHQQAKQAARLYDVPITLIHAGGNLGFAAGKNLAARYASSGRLLLSTRTCCRRNPTGWRSMTNLRPRCRARYSAPAFTTTTGR